MTDYRALAREIAADLTPMYVPDGTSGRFERVDMTHVLEHVLVVIERHQPQGAVALADAAEKFLADMDALENSRPASSWFALKEALRAFRGGQCESAPIHCLNCDDPECEGR
jgi:hypothetical protein